MNIIDKYLTLSESKDQDKELILNYCLEPKFTEKEVDDMKFYMSNVIASAILKVSGIREPDKQDSIGKELKN
ncbi:hypothetical protein KKD87_03050 [bacterium]|nr:hypothetical protein [bacterium]